MSKIKLICSGIITIIGYPFFMVINYFKDDTVYFNKIEKGMNLDRQRKFAMLAMIIFAVIVVVVFYLLRNLWR